MFSVKQKRHISQSIQNILRATGHPELPAGEIEFILQVAGAGPESWARIENNGRVETPSVNPHNEAQDPDTPKHGLALHHICGTATGRYVLGADMSAEADAKGMTFAEAVETTREMLRAGAGYQGRANMADVVFDSTSGEWWPEVFIGGMEYTWFRPDSTVGQDVPEAYPDSKGYRVTRIRFNRTTQKES